MLEIFAKITIYLLNFGQDSPERHHKWYVLYKWAKITKYFFMAKNSSKCQTAFYQKKDFELKYSNLRTIATKMVI